MLVSFIIPHKGRKEFLARTIQSILELEFDLKEVEIIVVTQNKELECCDIDLSNVHFTSIFRPEHETISTLRNVGVQNVSGEYLVFLDADVQLSRNWLNTMFNELDVNSERILIGAVQRYAPDAGRIEKIKTILNNTSADSPVKFLAGSNLFMHRETFEKVGGFPEHLMTCEDCYFTNKVHQLGEIYFTSKAFYIHLGEDKNYGEMFRKEIWRGQSNLQSLRGRKIVFREIPSIFTPLWQTFFLFGAILAVLWGRITVLLFCLVLMGLPSVFYAARLYKAGKNYVDFIDALGFYCVYHAARAIGTMSGVFKIIRI